MNKIASQLLLALLLSTPAHAGDREEAAKAFAQGDYESAMTISLRLGAEGDGDALANVGNMFAFGQGVQQDEAMAFEYWNKASEKHVPSAFGNIATCYMMGKCGVEADAAEAARWYKLGAEHGHVPSMITLSALHDSGTGITRDQATAMAWAGLAASSAASPDARDKAMQRLRQAGQGASKDDFDRTKAVADDLVARINENVARYKKRGQ